MNSHILKWLNIYRKILWPKLNYSVKAEEVKKDEGDFEEDEGPFSMNGSK